MKTHLQKLMATAVVGLVLCSNGVSAWAGVATRNEVYISPSRTNVQGSLTGARYSADSEQYLGCTAHSFSDPTSTIVTCSAKDKRGRTFFCVSHDPRMADAVKGMTDSSHLNVTAGFQGGNYFCSDLTISNESIYLR